MRVRVGKMVVIGSLAVLAGASAVMAYRLVRADVRAEIYRDRLAVLGDEYGLLADRYNDAVRRTAVTELVVQGGTLRVRVRTAAGVLREIETPYDPMGEIYVDYVVLDGRLWIRRVFDAATPPALGLVIDPELVSVDWDAPNASHGKAVYRRLGEGRWVISLTGNGALGLMRATDVVDLTPVPMIGDFEEMAEGVDARVRGIGVAEVFEHLVGGEH